MWRRAVAFLTDLLPLAVLAVVENALGIAEYVIVAALNLLFFITYFAGMNYQFGGTIGKRIMGLRVALPSTPAVATRLIGRALVKLCFLGPPLATLYALVAIWREDGRSFADFVSSTTVVDVATLTAPRRLSLLGRLLASALAVVAPWILLIILGVCLFGIMLFRELLKSL